MSCPEFGQKLLGEPHIKAHAGPIHPVCNECSVKCPHSYPAGTEGSEDYAMNLELTELEKAMHEGAA